MSIYQPPHRCWELQPPADDERSTHYDTEAAALEALAEDRENREEPCADTVPVQFAAPCWVVQCDGECETVLDTEDEGYVFHHVSRADAEQTAAGYDWAFDGEGRVFCEEDAPGDAVVLPSPAELEAAGQLVIPGVLP